MFPQALEDKARMKNIFRKGTGRDKEIIEVGEEKVGDVVTKDVGDEVLKDGWRVGETEGHDEILEMAASTPESGLPLVTRADANKVVSRTKIDLGEILSALDAVEEYGGEGKRVAILDGARVEVAVVDAWTQGAVCLFNEEDGGATGGA
jgi:hypothetical protein